MHETHIRGLDLNLLAPLEALLRLKSVTRAAEDVGLSQPAMSRALARLREVLADPLLVRTSSGFALTPRAAELHQRLPSTLDGVRALFGDTGFDPATARRTLRITATDLQAILLAPALMQRLAREAPFVDVQITGYRPDIAARMEAGDIDLTFAEEAMPLPMGTLSELVAQDRLALVMRKDHPAARRAWTIEDYARVDHVGVSIFGDGQSEMNAILAGAGVTRRIAIVTPHFAAAIAVAASTDLVTTISRVFALRFARDYDIVLKEPPFAQTGLNLTLVSTQIRAADPFLIWARKIVRETAAETLSLTPSAKRSAPAPKRGRKTSNSSMNSRPKRKTGSP